ncbi:MAG: alpha/beta fold hydrolase [Cyclobacteriaceae bacterium]|nr:alpha/beta fold hydrolase [Cyclobacteriaceae bacterium]
MSYKPPFILFNAHLETIFPSLIRSVDLQPYTRERITTPDADFLDLDWLTGKSNKLVIISHGLEGNSQRPYVKGMAKAFFNQGFDVLAWNYRGCSEEINNQLRFYHSGATDDLDTVIQHAVRRTVYSAIYLVGFSLGGNLTLKYLGERPPNSRIKKAVAFSVPMDLHASCQKISNPSNWIYANRFLKSLKGKIIAKAKQFKELDTNRLDKIKSLQEFDDHYTAPLHGFQHAVQYYETCSSIRFVMNITVPTLIINANNDPFLSEECFPIAMLKHHSFVTFEKPLHGGHVGFTQFNREGLYWSEARAIEFFIS